MRRQVLILLLLAALALSPRLWQLGASGLQNDETIWHERSARFVQQVLGPLGPRDLVIPKVFYPVKHVDLTGDKFALPAKWPFNIRMPAHHPGTSISLMMGLSYVFLAEGSSNWSLGLLTPIEAGRLPNAILGTALVLLIYLGGRMLVGGPAAFAAALIAAFEPNLVGYSRLARVDLAGAVFITAAFFAWIAARRRASPGLAVLAGAMGGLAFSTNPFGLLILPVIAVLRFTESPVTPWREQGWKLWRWFDRLDLRFMIAWIGVYVLSYPNLWPNPFTGFYKMADVIGLLPHVAGGIAKTMPLSPLFYAARFPEHLLPWLVALIGLGLLIAFFRRDRAVLPLVIWVVSFLVLLSVMPGYKEVKNALAVLPPLMLLAGYGLTRGVGLVVGDRLRPAAVPVAAMAVAAAGLWVCLAWWPYPRLYTWEWRPDPQTLDLRELVAEGEGVKEALDYIAARDPAGSRIGLFTGLNNALYYRPAERLGDPVHPSELKDYGWLVVLPKISFGSPATHALVAWVRNNEPAYILRLHQIEMVRIYRLENGSAVPAP